MGDTEVLHAAPHWNMDWSRETPEQSKANKVFSQVDAGKPLYRIYLTWRIIS